MEFFKVKKFRKTHKPNPPQEVEDNPALAQADQLKNEDFELSGWAAKAVPSPEMGNRLEEDDDDDEFFTNEVKNKLKELRKNSFMVLIPEESSLYDNEEAEEEETSSAEWGDIEADSLRQRCSSFREIYNQYCERMLFFDRLSAQQLKEIGSQTPSTQSPRSASRSTSKKLTSPLRCLSLKWIEEPEEDTERLQKPERDSYEDLETAYVAQVCLTWEALRCQYSQLRQNAFDQPETPTCYSHSAQLFQQFQVLLQRFIENEPFEQGNRAENFTRTRNSLPKLLQVPLVQGSDHSESGEGAPDVLVLASDLTKIMEGAILTFHIFLKTDKKKKGMVSNLFGGQNQVATPLQLIQSSLEKKKMKLKELSKRKKGVRSKSWPPTQEEVELFFGLIDVKVMSRVLRMAKISKEQLIWCEEKINSMDVVDRRMTRDPLTLLFPC